MPVLRIKSHVLAAAILAAMVLSISLPGHSEDKAPWVGETLSGVQCIDIGNHISFGPFDYLRRAQLPAELEVVERAHFTPNVERLEAGNTSEAINDIAYTLAAWPNHHRALYSAMRYRMVAWEWPEDAQAPPAECQLLRAIAFSPNDPVPYMMLGMLLHKAQKYDEALLSYRAANRLRPDDVLTLYNMGLTLVELKQYKEAVQAAKTVYAAGIPLPGLKNKLIAAGEWPGAAKPAIAADAPQDVQEQQQTNEPVKKESAEKVVQNDKAKDKPKAKPAAKSTPITQPKTATQPKPVTQPKPATQPKPTTKAVSKDQLTIQDNTKDQPKATEPLATGDKQGVEAPEVTQ